MVHLVRITDALHMPRSAARPEAPQRTPRKGWLPQGRALSDVEFSWRHRIVCGLLAASLGLVTCSALLVHLFSGSTELHFHYFVVIALIALYQDWTVYALAIAFVGVQHGAVGVLDQHSVYDHGGNPWLWALIHAGFVLAESAVLVIFWYANEQSRRVEDTLRAELSEG